MAMESWSANAYRTFATSRRDDVFESREASALSFTRSATAGSGGGGEVGCEKEVYYDTDVKVQWESVVRMALRKSPEFEFEFKSAPVSPVVTSSHCKPHQVYGRAHLSDERASTFVVSQRTVPEPFSQMSPHRLSRMYQPKYSKFNVNATDVAPVETAVDSRSSSFRSQTSMCEPSDTGNSTSTSRDSNGSSNDASSVSTDTTFDHAFDVFDHRSRTSAAASTTPPPSLKSEPPPFCPTPRFTSVVASDQCDLKVSGNLSTSWLRSPLKWKGIFGARKAPKPVRVSDPLTSRPTSKVVESSPRPRPKSRLFHPASCDDKIVTNQPLPSKPRSFLAHGPQYGGVKPVDQSSRDAKVKPTFASNVSSDIHAADRDHSGLVKIRERWLKYMRMLKPPYGRASSSKAEINSAEERGGSFPDRACATPGHQDRYVHTRAKSMPAILKTPRSISGAVSSVAEGSSVRSSMIPPAGPSSARKNSFLAHNSSLVSTSPRFMKSSSPRLMSLSPKVMKSSSSSSPKVSVTTISPRMSSSSTSSLSELHSAVQGAIAHCKQSHSGLLSPGPSSSGYHH